MNPMSDMFDFNKNMEQFTKFMPDFANAGPLKAFTEMQAKYRAVAIEAMNKNVELTTAWMQDAAKDATTLMSPEAEPTAYAKKAGEVAQIDPRPGHIPGARNAPWAAVLDADGRFRSPEALREHFASLGAGDGDDTVAYCGSGVSACMNVLAMERAGLTPPRLYVASWSGWSSDPDRPAELGPSRSSSDE